MEAFVTGGAGYLGRALLAGESTPRFTVFSRDEHKQWKLKEQYRECRFALGDVRDMIAVQTAMPYRVPVVIHAAAQKFVPEGEDNAIEFAQTNIEGTINVGLAAGLNRVGVAVLISTDKALNPVSNYGATKMVAERVWLELNDRFTDTDFVVVRYGNVIGSTGSVVELFRKQLAAGNSVNVTSEDASRFWMTAKEAVDTIWWAASHVTGGRVIVPLAALRQGSIRNLLAAMKVPNDRRNIIGMRPGEKMHETIIGEHEIKRTILHRDGYAIIMQQMANQIGNHVDFPMQPGDGAMAFSDFVQHGKGITSGDVRNLSDYEFQEILRDA